MVVVMKAKTKLGGLVRDWCVKATGIDLSEGVYAILLCK